ncbi:MAG: diaminopimelate decarboxylase [Verrucomicrobia bacterium]|nr:diaminopimelate decarboxylase [Verrucomicrobiota bacterium]
MHRFQRKGGKLYAEGVALDSLANRLGTPLYVYSAGTILDHYRRLCGAMRAVDPMICYSVKANSNLAVLSLLARAGSGFDVVSGGELERVKKAGGKASKCVFAGVGKTDDEIEAGLRLGVKAFHVESEEELDRIAMVAGRKKGRRAPVSLRVNPDVEAGGHAKITTGTYANKFGIPYELVAGAYRRHAGDKRLKWVGVQMHIGSQITRSAPFRAAVRKMIPLVERLRDRHGLEYFDLGGGVGIVYEDALASGRDGWWKSPKAERAMTLAEYATSVIPMLRPLKMEILLEPGRFLVGNAGVLLAEVLYRKQTGRKHFTVVDAGMNDLVRPAMYEAFHQIEPVGKPRPGALSTDVVGPVCESGDVFAHDRSLPPLERGDRVAILSAGAYGFSMASSYNTRPRPAEVLVSGTRAKLIRRRETVADLWRGESRS